MLFDFVALFHIFSMFVCFDGCCQSMEAAELASLGRNSGLLWPESQEHQNLGLLERLTSVYLVQTHQLCQIHPAVPGILIGRSSGSAKIRWRWRVALTGHSALCWPRATITTSSQLISTKGGNIRAGYLVESLPGSAMRTPPGNVPKKFNHTGKVYLRHELYEIFSTKKRVGYRRPWCEFQHPWVGILRVLAFMALTCKYIACCRGLIFCLLSAMISLISQHLTDYID